MSAGHGGTVPEGTPGIIRWPSLEMLPHPGNEMSRIEDSRVALRPGTTSGRGLERDQPRGAKADAVSFQEHTDDFAVSAWW